MTQPHEPTDTLSAPAFPHHVWLTAALGLAMVCLIGSHALWMDRLDAPLGRVRVGMPVVVLNVVLPAISVGLLGVGVIVGLRQRAHRRTA